MKKIFFVYLLVLIVIILIQCSENKNEYVIITGYSQGTTYKVVFQGNPDKITKQTIDKQLSDFDMIFSEYINNSLISRINNNSTNKIDDNFQYMIELSLRIYRETNGAFDITVGPVVNALGFGSTDKIDIDSTIIDSLMQYVGMEKISIKNRKLYKSNPNVIIDLNAIAQGYSVDLLCNFLDSSKVKNYLVEVGGEIKTKGVNKNGALWRIGIDKPIENNMVPGSELQAIVQLDNKSLATSGNYRRFYEKNGIKYSHTINPATGYPARSNLLSTTVIATECAVADAYATSFMVMGLEKSIEFVKNHPGLEVYFVYGDLDGSFRDYATEGIKQSITKVDQ